MKRRSFIGMLSLTTAGLLLPSFPAYSKTYLSIEQARSLIWGDLAMDPITVELTKEQMDSIGKASDTRVRHSIIKAWKSTEGHWYLLDQVIGKHENIDLAVGIDNEGKIKGIEVLIYRETYGDQIMHPKWRAQFHGRDNSEILRLDDQVKNISGATLSCRHVTDGVNRLTHTWSQVLRNL